MENPGSQVSEPKYNDSAADAVATVAIITIVMAAVIFWLAGQ